jgi:hypothetical protein
MEERMSKTFLDVAKESSIQEILSKIEDGSGLHIIEEQTQISHKVVEEIGILPEFTYSDGTLEAKDNSNAIAVNCNGNLYFMINNDDTLYMFKSGLDCKQVVCNLPYDIDVHETSVVVFKNQIHLLGGGDTNTRTHYKLNGTVWEAVSTLPYDFCGGRVTVYNDEIHIIGGGTNRYADTYNASEFINKHYKFNGDEWTEVSELPYITRGCTVFTLRDGIHIVGGTTINKDDNGQNHFVWNGTSWVNSTSLPMDRYNSSSIVCSNTEVYITGGKSSESGDKLISTVIWDGTSFEISEALLADDGTNDSPYSLTYDNDRIPMIFGRRIFRLTSDSWKALYSFGSFDNGTAIEYDDELHVFYGLKHYRISDETNGVWEELPVNKYNCTGASAIVMEDGIHLLGSASSPDADFHYRWDGTIWKAMSNLPNKLINGVAVVYKGNIHIIGGTSLNNAAYNHYMLVDSQWISAGRTPYDVVGNKAAVVFNDCIYAIGKDESNTEYLMEFNGTGWKVITSWGISSNTITLGNPSLVVYNDKLYLFDIDLESGNILPKIFLNANGGGMSGKYLSLADTFINIDTINPVAVIYNSKIYIVTYETEDGGNLISFEMNVENLKGLNMWIPKNHQFICDKSIFLPIIGNMKETENGFLALETALYSIYATSYDEPYSVC